MPCQDLALRTWPRSSHRNTYSVRGALDDRLGPTVGPGDHAEGASKHASAAERKIICDCRALSTRPGIGRIHMPAA